MKNENQSTRHAVLMLRHALLVFGLLIAISAESQSDPAPGTPEIQQGEAIDTAGDSDDAAKPAVTEDNADIIPTAGERDERETIEPDKKEPETGKRSAADQVFIPSEEISEDKPVPFPVDI